jgi:hypothetical protein
MAHTLAATVAAKPLAPSDHGRAPGGMVRLLAS